MEKQTQTFEAFVDADFDKDGGAVKIDRSGHVSYSVDPDWSSDPSEMVSRPVRRIGKRAKKTALDKKAA